MPVTVLFFGILKDIVGRGEDRIEPQGAVSLDSIFDRYAREFPRLKELAPSLVFARNQQFCARDAAVEPGDEIAFLPPVSGGLNKYTQQIADGRSFFALTREPIDTPALSRHVLRPDDGAIVTFEGVVRNNTNGRATEFLEYECYEPMAVKVMASIGREIVATHAIGAIAMVHRLGRLEIGEASVAVVVAAPHRKPAFEAALEGINRLKRLVPVWKKEHFAGGEVWVEGEWDASVLPPASQATK